MVGHNTPVTVNDILYRNTCPWNPNFFGGIIAISEACPKVGPPSLKRRTKHTSFGLSGSIEPKLSI